MLPADLRDQAWHLARLERRRPKQASLRRAVSTAYYALFHLLVGEATRMMFLGRWGDRNRFRAVIARGFTHSGMVGARKSFYAASLPAGISGMLGPVIIAPDLRYVAEAFVRLQRERHRADYDLSASFSRTEVTSLLRALDGAIEAWRRIRNDDVARFFLRALPLWEQIRR
jgi:uncharacterized protein (UPF0332 family)